MSGFVGTALGVASGIGVLTGLINGSTSPLVLGNFQFQSFEVPETISFGGKNDITVHKLGGSTKVFDVMGTNENDLRWRGRLLSYDAQVRAATLQTMRTSCQILPLVWGVFYYRVIIDHVDFVYHQTNHIDYDITVTVITASPVQATSASLAAQVDADVLLADAVYIATEINDFIPYASNVSDAVAPLVTAIASAPTLQPGSASTQVLYQTATATQNALSATSSTAQAQLSALGSGPSQGGGMAAVSYVNNAAALTSQVSSINMVQNYIGRTVNNLAP